MSEQGLTRGHRGVHPARDRVVIVRLRTGVYKIPSAVGVTRRIGFGIVGKNLLRDGRDIFDDVASDRGPSDDSTCTRCAAGGLVKPRSFWARAAFVKASARSKVNSNGKMERF